MQGLGVQQGLSGAAGRSDMAAQQAYIDKCHETIVRMAHVATPQSRDRCCVDVVVEHPLALSCDSSALSVRTKPMHVTFLHVMQELQAQQLHRTKGVIVALDEQIRRKQEKEALILTDLKQRTAALLQAQR